MTALRNGGGDPKAEIKARGQAGAAAVQRDPRSFMSGLMKTKQTNDLSHFDQATGYNQGRTPVTLGNSNPNKKQTLGGI